MWKFLFLAVFCFFTVSEVFASQPDTLNYYTVSADERGFMCPFLTPNYIRKIESASDCNVRKDKDLVIHIVCYQNNQLSGDKLLDMAEMIGYERKNIHVRQIK